MSIAVMPYAASPARLTHLKDHRPVILGGGVTIGFEIAQALGAPLDIVLAREIGVPWRPELALGAVTDGAAPDSFIDRALATRLDVSENHIRTETERQLQEIERRRNSYCAARPPTEIAGFTAIVVYDGIATGATMRVAACCRIAASSPGRGTPIDPGFTGRARRFDHDPAGLADWQCQEQSPTQRSADCASSCS
jgi:putative phosphoribosyl transferase